MHNIYIDGSCQDANKLIGIGIYNSTTKFELSMVKDGDNVYDAEYGALEEAIRYCQFNGIVKQSRIFTDSDEVYRLNKEYVLSLGFADFIWIPRELNVKADKLSTSYKEYTKSTKTKISLTNNTVIRTTKIKEVTSRKVLAKTQIIDILNEFSEDKKMKLIEKLKDTSGVNKAVYDYYFGNSKTISKQKKNTYFLLIPLLIDGTKNKNIKKNLLERIKVEGINMLLENIKLKEVK